MTIKEEYKEYGIVFTLIEYRYHTGHGISMDYEVYNGILNIDGKNYKGFYKIHYYADFDNNISLEYYFPVDEELKYILPCFGKKMFRSNDIYVSFNIRDDYERKYKIKAILMSTTS